MTLTTEEQLNIICKAWGMQDGGGYVFFPWIVGDARTKEERVRGYHEGPGFRWPEDRADIIAHLEAHTNDDVYWCPNMFEKHIRRREFAMDECALWADLDDVDPRGLDEFKPTVAWQTSESHYQALWITRRPILGASWPGEENQKLTYYLGADNNGWDTTQLLRLPGWGNHKPDRRKGKKAWPGKLLWANGPRYSRHQFETLPDVVGRTDAIRQVLESDLDAVDTSAVMARVRLKISKRVREFLGARERPNKGSRSEILWEIERELADAGCTLAEIIAIVQRSVWNKYSGRSDELLRLSTEASRALDEASEGGSVFEIERPGTTPRIEDFLRDIKPPKWLIKDIWTQASCGFVAGQPKCWKSWFTLDMALSISTGSPFLGQFDVVEPGPVLYIQEEDPAARLKVRYGKVWDSKADWRVELDDEGLPIAVPGHQITRNPDIGIHLKCGIELSDEAWQEWLKDRINEGMDGTPYRAVILDPLMYMLGDVDENKSGPMMTKVFKPLKVIAEEMNVAIIVIHHMRKLGNDKSGGRGGQTMLGSVANHAWTEDSLYLTRTHNEVHVEVESKTAVGGHFKVAGLRNRGWTPHPYDIDFGMDELTPPDERKDVEVRTAQSNGARKGRPAKALASLQALGQGTTSEIAAHAGLTRQGAHNQLTRGLKHPTVERNGSGKWRWVA